MRLAGQGLDALEHALEGARKVFENVRPLLPDSLKARDPRATDEATDAYRQMREGTLEGRAVIVP